MSMFDNRDQMWFGTEEYSQWIETPQTGADVSPVGFGASATGLNGFGYVRNSWDSHKVYQFSWGDSADLDLASIIHAYRNGTYGRGLIYFQDPMTYNTNVLARRVADPSMAINYEAEPLIRGIWPRSTPTGANPNRLPVQTAIYDVPAGYDAETAGDEIYVPVPQGYIAALGGIYTSSDVGANIYYKFANGIKQTLTASSKTTTGPIHTGSAPTPWVRLGMRNTTGTAQTISITALSARLISLLSPDPDITVTGPWMSGEGNSGCEFQGSPTLVNYNGVNGGQVGVACTLVETGAWK